MAVRDGELSERFAWPSEPCKPFRCQIEIFAELGWLFAKLAEGMREKSGKFLRGAPRLDDYRYILSRLRHEFDVDIYNLNYDNVATTA
jgi:hypothetical protein